MPSTYTSRPNPSEYNVSYKGYVDLVEAEDVIGALELQLAATKSLLHGLPENAGRLRYEPGKWSLNEVIGHMIDAERVFSYRLLRIARGDATPMPSFDQDSFVAASGHDECSLHALAEEFATVRHATLFLLKHLPDEAWTRVGNASGWDITARGLAWIIAGHELHHVRVIRAKYLKPSSVARA